MLNRQASGLVKDPVSKLKDNTQGMMPKVVSSLHKGTHTHLCTHKDTYICIHMGAKFEDWNFMCDKGH